MECGYTIIKHDSILVAARKIRKSLAYFLANHLRHPVSVSDSAIHSALHQLRLKDESKYLRHLKTFSSSITVLAPTSNNEVHKVTTALGIELPTLVTPPLLHVIAPNLIIEPKKVFLPWHRDIDSTRGSGGSCVIWMPLTPVDKESSPLQFIPHSHRWKHVELQAQNQEFSVVDDRVTEAESAEVLLDLGQLVVFSTYLIHRAQPGNGFRLALSWRLNDGADPVWADRNFYNPWVRTYESVDPNSPQFKISDVSSWPG